MSNFQEPSKSRQALALSGGKFGALFLTFVTPMFLTRFLSREGYGIYAQFNTVTNFIITVASFGLPTALYYYIPRLKNHQYRSAVVNLYLSLLISAGLSCLLLLIPAVGRFIGGDEIFRYIGYICVYMLFYMPSELMEAFYIVINDNKSAIWYPPCSAVLRIVGVIAGALVTGSVEGIFIGSIAAQGLIFIGTTIYYWRRTRVSDANTRPTLFDWRLWKGELKYVVPFGFGAVLFALSCQFDKLLCINVMTPREYSIYIVAFLGIPGVQLLYTSISTPYLVGMSRLFIQNDTEAVRKMFCDLSCRILSFTLPLILIVSLYAREIICFLYTEKYSEATFYFRVYVCSILFSSLGTCIIIRASGKTKYTMISYILSACLTIPGTIFAIYHWGALGAIFSAFCGIAFPKIIQSYFEIRLLNTSLGKYMAWGRLAKIAAISLLLWLPFLLLHLLVKPGVYICGLLSCCYLALTGILLIRHKLFVIDARHIMNIVNRLPDNGLRRNADRLITGILGQ